MWSRRAQEYETKIFSGDPIKISEAVRDLFRKSSQAEQSYSERQCFKSLLRLAREIGRKTDYLINEKIEQILNKNNILDNISNFVEINKSNKIWAIGSIHSNLNSFTLIKEFILKNYKKNDKLIFLGNIILERIQKKP